MMISFPPPRSVVDRYVDPAGSREVFWKATERLQRRTVKLERHQDFQEPGNPSWEALVAGDTQRAIELIEDGSGDQVGGQKTLSSATSAMRARDISGHSEASVRRVTMSR